MNLIKKQNGKTLEISLEGRLDTVTAPELEAELNRCLPDADSLIFDFSGLDYISSAGLRLLLTAHKQMSTKDGMTIRNAKEIVREVFEVTGFSAILAIA